MSVIEASSAGVKDMADGSLRITFEFEPRHAAEAFALFGPRGRAVAVAALKDGAAAAPDIAHPISEKKEREQLGDLCYRAVMWCSDPEFQRWLLSTRRLPVANAADAAQVIKEVCGVETRKHLDTIAEAGEIFRKEFVGPWQKHQIARRSA